MKIDIYSHFIPQKYHDELCKHLGKPYPMAITNPCIIDLDSRLRLMDKYDEYMQVLVPGGPPIEAVAEPKKASELARIANDSMAEIVEKRRDRFAAGGAIVANKATEQGSARKK